MPLGSSGNLEFAQSHLIWIIISMVAFIIIAYIAFTMMKGAVSSVPVKIITG